MSDNPHPAGAAMVETAVDHEPGELAVGAAAVAMSNQQCWTMRPR
jgi:hypothetical protein